MEVDVKLRSPPLWPMPQAARFLRRCFMGVCTPQPLIASWHAQAIAEAHSTLRQYRLNDLIAGLHLAIQTWVQTNPCRCSRRHGRHLLAGWRTKVMLEEWHHRALDADLDAELALMAAERTASARNSPPHTEHSPPALATPDAPATSLSLCPCPRSYSTFRN